MRFVAALALVVAGCATSQDPAEGGFISGVQNLSDGTYAKRVEEKEKTVAEKSAEAGSLEAEKSRLEAEIGATETDLAAARREVIRLRYALTSAKKPIPPEIEEKVVTLTTATPPPDADPAAKLAALRQTLADTRALAETLTKLSS
jgi:septal ring factor EnvC (AmiA/AmiB activator)